MYQASNIIPMLMKWRKECGEQATCMGKMRIHCKYMVEHYGEKNTVNIGVNKRIILIHMSNTQDLRIWVIRIKVPQDIY
jgi:hypothetical protein